MDFSEKLQTLRKERGLTQEQLADTIFVSRTAVSKWESGRGYPSLDYLKAVSKLFSVSIDDLLSGEELVKLAETDTREKTKGLLAAVFGICDCMPALLFFLPLFGIGVHLKAPHKARFRRRFESAQASGMRYNLDQIF